MALPYVILVLGYALLASLFLWIGISIKGKWIIKFALAPFILWFGLFLYFIPPQLAGYPSDQEIVEERVIVRYFTYKAPTNDDEGEIYIVADNRFYPETMTKDILEKFDPKSLADISQGEFLRLYRLPWDEQMVKDMTKAQKKRQLITLRKTKKGEGQSGNQTGEGKGKSKGKKGSQNGKNPSGRLGDGDKGQGGTGGTAKTSRDKSMYSVEALTPNEVFQK